MAGRAALDTLPAPAATLAVAFAVEFSTSFFEASGISRMLAHLKKWIVGLGAAMVAATSFGAAGNAYSAPKTVLVVGDSLSAEYGLARGSGWVALLDQRLRAQKI